MRLLSMTLLFAFPTAVWAGTLGSSVPWIVEVTSQPELHVNNDDYVGALDGNPNHFQVNEWGDCQSILSLERLVPTSPSGGTTEYALFLCSGINTIDEFRPGMPTALDNVFQLQIGFGTGDGFVPAGEVAPDLRFDRPNEVSPPIDDIFYRSRPLPMLELVGHESDTLTFQGRSYVSDSHQVVEYWWKDAFHVPIDIPDLDPSLRDLYSPEDLALIPSETDVPFTIRMLAVPEPAALALAIFGLSGVLLCDAGRPRTRLRSGSH